MANPSKSHSAAISARIGTLKTASFVLKVLSGICLLLVLLFILPMIQPVIEDGLKFGSIRKALEVERTVNAFIKSNIPTRFGGHDLSRWIGIGLSFIFSGILSRWSVKLHNQAQFLEFRHKYDEWRVQMKLSDNAILLGPLNEKLERMKTAGKKDREQLLKDFAETKRRLDEMGRDLAFLAIDIVDSTGMKQGEERPIVEHDFKEYKRFVDRVLQSYGCLKSTWTPDGVMSCFTTVDAAVGAARGVINGLDDFNKNVKYMKRDFTVRCGVNSGFVYYDPAVPLEEVSDRVIDIAGHMQKHALPNTVAVAKPTIEPLNKRNGFEPSGRTVDGYEVYEWRK